MQQSTVFNTFGHVTDEALSRYIDQQLKQNNAILSTQEQTDIANHLKACFVCSNAYHSVYQYLSDEQRNPSEMKTPGLILRFIRKPAFIAGVSIAAVLFIVFLIVLYNRHEPEITKDNHIDVKKDSVKIVKTDTVIQPIKTPEKEKDLWAGNFVPSRDFENLMKQNFRSGESFELLSPMTDMKAFKEISFRWNYSGKETIILKILNNKEKTIMTIKPEQNEYLLQLNQKIFVPGIYYWKIETEEDLLSVGKFIVPRR